MATYPFKVFGACRSTAKRVFKVKFSQPLSSVPNIRCYDNSGTYPTTGGGTATTFRIFKGTSANSNLPMLIYIDTSRGGPAASNWYASAQNSGAKATIRMAGDSGYLQFRYSVASLTANASLTWNAIIETCCNVNPTMTRLHDVVFRYTFISTIPDVSFYANNLHAGGSDGDPAWGTITPNTHGIKFGAITATNSSILANIPLAATASVEITRTAWVTT